MYAVLMYPTSDSAVMMLTDELVSNIRGFKL